MDILVLVCLIITSSYVLSSQLYNMCCTKILSILIDNNNNSNNNNNNKNNFISFVKLNLKHVYFKQLL